MRFIRSSKINVTTERPTIEIRGISVEIVRKDIKNLHVGVYPPKGRVRVAAPLRLDDQAIRLAIISRLGWIRRQQQNFQQQERQSQREMVTGESHYFLGQRYRLRVVPHHGSPKVLTRNKVLELHIRPQTETDVRERILQGWYRQQLKELIPPLLEKWQRTLGVQVLDWCVRKMKTKWGSCNADAGRIWLNLELVKKPIQCLEYLTVHELVHLVERRHNDTFIAIMDKHLPQWRLHRAELNRAPLSHETWTY